MARDQGTSEFSDLRPKEKCGIIGCAGTSPITSDLYYGLRILQHRGQESAGLAVYDDGLKSKRGMGLVHEVFTKEDLVELRGNSGIGHVRYSTTGSSVLDNAQPIVAKTSYGEIALAHNGDIANANEIREELSKKGWAFMTTSDSEVIVRLLANEIVNTGDVKRALREFTNRLVGAYSLALMINDSVYAIRDPLAIRPLCIGEGNDRMMIASESVVFDTLPGYRFIRDLKPGEIVELRSDGFESTRLPHPNHTAHCMFELVYFARSDSVLDERLVGARAVKMRTGCRPNRFPCYLGIDMKTRDQFIANEKTVPEIADFIEADSLGYLSLRGLISALKHSRDDICLGCLTGEYPVPIPGEKMRKEKPLEMFSDSATKPSARKKASSSR